MKLKFMSLVIVIAVGILVLMLTMSNYASVESEYNANLTKARSNAEKQIPYNAYNYYKAAFEIRCEDESIYKEYLGQAKILGENFYSSAIKEYVDRFPTSAEGYELLCQWYYENSSYSALIDTALEARTKGIATEQVRDWYNECAYMLRNVRSGFEQAQSFLGGYALVKANGSYGYISMNGEYLLAPIYTQASAMMTTGTAVNDGDEWHIVNSSGYKVARTSSAVDYMGIMVDGKIPISKDGGYAYVNGALTIPTELPYDYASNFKYGIAAVRKGEKWALINSDEKPITDFIFDDVVLDEFETCYNGGVVFVKKDGKYFMVNAEGQKITDQAFDDAKPFVSTEPAAVCINGQWGFVDTSGNMVIKPQYDNASSFNIGLAGVCVDGLWGYINSSATLRVECQFEDCLPFASNGIAAVKENGFWKYVMLFLYCD